MRLRYIGADVVGIAVIVDHPLFGKVLDPAENVALFGIAEHPEPDLRMNGAHPLRRLDVLVDPLLFHQPADEKEPDRLAGPGIRLDGVPFQIDPRTGDQDRLLGTDHSQKAEQLHVGGVLEEDRRNVPERAAVEVKDKLLQESAPLNRSAQAGDRRNGGNPRPDRGTDTVDVRLDGKGQYKVRPDLGEDLRVGAAELEIAPRSQPAAVQRRVDHPASRLLERSGIGGFRSRNQNGVAAVQKRLDQLKTGQVEDPRLVAENKDFFGQIFAHKTKPRHLAGANPARRIGIFSRVLLPKTDISL